MTKRETARRYLPLNVIQQEGKNNTYEILLEKKKKRLNLDSPVDLTTN